MPNTGYTKDCPQRLIADQIEESGEFEYKAARRLSSDNAATDSNILNHAVATADSFSDLG